MLLHPRTLGLIALIGLLTPACSRTTSPASTATLASDPSPTTSSAASATETPTPQPTATASASATPVPPTSTPEPVGPEFRSGFNPLTGLPIDTDHLEFAPLLVAITNFPPSARPQAGLSLADHVWESSIAQGQTRFLAVFYGVDWEEYASVADSSDLPYDHILGPVRSGRVAFEDIRSFYPGALLVTRAASYQVLPELNNQITLYNKDDSDVNSSGLTYQEIMELPLNPGQPSRYAGLRFDSEAPLDGQPAPDLTVIYNVYAQYGWRYDPASNRYGRLQAPFEGDGPMTPLVDRLTGQPLQFDNVVVLFAQHKFENLAATILEIDLRYLPERYGLLFRDGQVYEINWSSLRNEFRLLDGQGNDFPLKPGKTFYELVSFRSTWHPGDRLVRYHQPPLPTFTATATVTITPTPTGTVSPTASP